MKKKKSAGIALDASEKFVSGLAYVLMTLFALCAILPCLHVISKAFSKGTYVTAGLVNFWPKGFQLETIQYILFQTDFFNALKNTLIVTGVGTLISLFTSITTAYPLSKPAFRGRKVITLLYVFSMVFFGGMIPAYMVVRMLGILDTYAAMILPFAIVQFNMFIVKNYFEGLPEIIEESARIDGAGPWRFFVDVVLPLSRTNTAALFVVLFIYGWNQYLWPLLVTNQENMYTIVMGIQRMVNIPDAVPEWNLIMAVALLGMLPPLLAVLGMQKLFVRGLVETEK